MTLTVEQPLTLLEPDSVCELDGDGDTVVVIVAIRLTLDVRDGVIVPLLEMVCDVVCDREGAPEIEPEGLSDGDGVPEPDTEDDLVVVIVVLTLALLTREGVMVPLLESVVEGTREYETVTVTELLVVTVELRLTLVL